MITEVKPKKSSRFAVNSKELKINGYNLYTNNLKKKKIVKWHVM